MTRLTALHARSGAVLRRLEAELEHNPAARLAPARSVAAHAQLRCVVRARAGAWPRSPGAGGRRLTAFDPRRSIYEVVATIDASRRSTSRAISLPPGPIMSMLMKVSDIAWFVRGYAGNDRRTTATLIAEGRAPNPQELDHMAHVRGAIDGPWQFIGMAARQKDFRPRC